ncbi:MAG: hypothetical protein V3S33_00430, partial [Gammaproteobacteria bacterium]
MNPIADRNSEHINVQLPLGLSLRDSARFESFYSGPNREVKQALRHGLRTLALRLRPAQRRLQRWRRRAG